MKWLNGNKTYIGMIVTGLLFILRPYFPEQEAAIDNILKVTGTLTGIALRHAVSKAEMPKE